MILENTNSDGHENEYNHFGWTVPLKVQWAIPGKRCWYLKRPKQTRPYPKRITSLFWCLHAHIHIHIQHWWNLPMCLMSSISKSNLCYYDNLGRMSNWYLAPLLLPWQSHPFRPKQANMVFKNRSLIYYKCDKIKGS